MNFARRRVVAALLALIGVYVCLWLAISYESFTLPALQLLEYKQPPSHRATNVKGLPRDLPIAIKSVSAPDQHYPSNTSSDVTRTWDNSFANPERFYAMAARLVHSELSTAAVSVTISLVYQPPADYITPRASFRVYTTGASYTAVSPLSSILHIRQSAVTVTIPIIDSGNYSIHAKLMNYNLDAMRAITRNYQSQEYVNASDVASQWVDRPIVNSPINLTITITDDHDPQSLATRPLCFSDWTSHSQGVLGGRWRLGERHEHRVEAFDSSESVYNYYSPRYDPYHCTIDNTAAFRDELQRLKWLYFVGDSNTRHLFEFICLRALNGTVVEAENLQIREWDAGKLCWLDDGSVALTYTTWHWGMRLPLDRNFSWHAQCSQYTENTTAVWDNLEHRRRGWPTQYGWPRCANVSMQVYKLKAPGLTWFSVGSHHAEIGASYLIAQFLYDELLTHPHFLVHPTVIALTPEVDSGRIPAKFGSQYVYRNNDRVEAVNNMVRGAVRHHWHKWPINGTDGNNSTVSGFNPILDLFAPSHGIAELIHVDAVHFAGPYQGSILAWLTHWLKHAPQLKAGFRKVDSDITAAAAG